MHRNNGRYSLTKSSNGGGSHVGELLEHLALAMTMHVRHLRQDALRVPPSIDELAAVLVHYVQTRQIATLAEHEWTAMSRAAHYPGERSEGGQKRLCPAVLPAEVFGDLVEPAVTASGAA